MKRLIHDVAHPLAVSIVECLRPLIRDDEVRDAYEEIYTRATAALEAFVIEWNREKQRLNPVNKN